VKWNTDLLIRVHGSEAAAVASLSTLGGNVLNLLLGASYGQLRKLKVIWETVPVSEVAGVVVVCHGEINLVCC
jgi:hypothetical protein